jgi:hypothetical protein
MYSTMLVVSDFDLGQLKGYRSVRITSKESVTMGILKLVKCIVQVTGQTQITNQFAQHLFNRLREKLQNLRSITILVHVKNLQITAVYGSLKALQHVSVNVVCIEFRIFQDILDEIHNCCCCERMLTSSDDIYSISVQCRRKSVLLKLKHQTSYTISYPILYTISNIIAVI